MNMKEFQEILAPIKQALEAIKNFEEEGDPMWDDILEEVW